VARGRQAAASDLFRQLQSLGVADPILVMAAEQTECEDLVALGAEPLVNPPGTFNFGMELARFVEERGFERLAYFGGASAPLMSMDLLSEAFDRVTNAEKPIAVVNNYYSTDWVVLNHAQSLVALARRLPTDNPLGWVLEHDAGFYVHGFPPSAATRVDIDTPTDLLLLPNHPHLGPDLTTFLADIPSEWLHCVDQLREVLSTPASTLVLIGRASSHAWRTLEDRTQIWIRVFVEERGMIASGRMERGEVMSFVGEIVEEWGPKVFIEYLSRLSDAVLWDTRVWMAHRGPWPSVADRFAADLGWVEQVKDSALRELTQAIKCASIPIIAGGHGVVSGGLYVVLETLDER
jgi:hypothetical protein